MFLVGGIIIETVPSHICIIYRIHIPTYYAYMHKDAKLGIKHNDIDISDGS